MDKTAWFVVAGQSLAGAWFTERGALNAFRSDFLARNPQYTDVQFFNATSGGSALLKASAAATAAKTGEARTAQNYWYDETRSEPGPRLHQFIGKLHTWAQGKNVLGIIWDQGQADTYYVADAGKAATYTKGLNYTMRELMNASGATTVYIQAFGDRAGYKASLHGGADLMHNIQQDFAHDYTYAKLVTATYNLMLKDTVHLTTGGTIIAARRMADAISTGIASPALDHAVMARDGKIYASFSLNKGQDFDALTGLAGFHLNGKAEAIGSIRIDNNADLIVITPVAAVSHAHVQYASASYSFTLGADDFFTASGTTGKLPVQPFDLDLAKTAIAIAARIGGGYAITGDRTANTLHGFASRDILKGGDGNDTLDGGGGNDTLVGGNGKDGFVFRAGIGTDKVVDFIAAQDHIDLEGYTFADLQIRAYGAGSSYIRGPAGDRMVLVGIAPAALTADVFHSYVGDHIDF